MTLAPLKGKLWKFVQEDVGAVRQKIVGTATDQLSQEHASMIAHLLKDDLRRNVLIVAPGRREPQSPNPRGPRGSFDADAARELELFIENDADLYRQQLIPILKNLWLKMRKGRYDHAKAPKLWRYLVDNGARKYAQEFGEGRAWASLFTVPTRDAVAQSMADDYRGRLERREYSSTIQREANPKRNPARSKLKRIQRAHVRRVTSRKFRRALHQGTARERAGGPRDYAKAGYYQARSEARRAKRYSNPRIGERVQLHPATDEWMQGDRYGEIVGFGRARDYRDAFTGKIEKRRPVRVKLDRSGRVRRFHPDNIMPIENPAPRIMHARASARSVRPVFRAGGRFGIKISRAEVGEFKQSWPLSKLPYKNLKLWFDAKGDLVATSLTERELERIYENEGPGNSFEALIESVRPVLQKLQGRKGA